MYVNVCYISLLVCVHQNVNVPQSLASRQTGLLLRVKGALSGTSAGIVRHTRVCVCCARVREGDYVCLFKKESAYVCEEEIVSVCEGLLNTLSVVPVCTRLCFFCLYLRYQQTECAHICIQCVRTNVCVHFGFCFVAIIQHGGRAAQTPSSTLQCSISHSK